MKLGAFSVSLSVKDIEESKSFYEKLGFKEVAGDIKQNWLIMKNENVVIGLFQGVFQNKFMLTFNPMWSQEGVLDENGTDIRKIQSELKSRGILIEHEVDENTIGPAYFKIYDPDGNEILFDQHV